jgi:hypothetical protein
MNAKDFETIVNQTLDACKNTLCNKAKEYAVDEDRLHNFKTAAALQGCTVERSLSGMLAKHVVSIFDMCDHGIYPVDTWQEKIGDAINYLLLLKAVIIEPKLLRSELKAESILESVKDDTDDDDTCPLYKNGTCVCENVDIEICNKLRKEAGIDK